MPILMPRNRSRSKFAMCFGSHKRTFLKRRGENAFGCSEGRRLWRNTRTCFGVAWESLAAKIHENKFKFRPEKGILVRSRVECLSAGDGITPFLSPPLLGVGPS